MGILSKLFGRDTTTDILDILESQHKEVDLLIEQLEKGEGDRVAVFTELADKLAAHAAVEEKLFYPAVMAKQTGDKLRESVEEHLGIKRVLADMLAAPPSDQSFLAKLSVLKEQVTHHAHEEEEGKLFPEVRALFTADERAGMGNEFLVMFEQLMRSHPYKNVPREIAAPAKLPPVSRR